MNKNISRSLLDNFKHEPTNDQKKLLGQISVFFDNDQHDGVFLLKGYAGTGKTTFVSTIVKSLPQLNFKTILLAPTGRAAKVLANYTTQAAFTIHKKIYRLQTDKNGFAKFVLQPNPHRKTVFIVDEASMIPDGETSLLDDLYWYVKNGVDCRLILIGDVAQLPPIGLSISPALDADYITRKFFVQVDAVELREVVRQKKTSGILANATRLRELLQSEENTPFRFSLKPFADIVQPHGANLQEELTRSYDHYGPEGTIVICRSNKRANIYNQQIRSRIKWLEDEIAVGDYLMSVKNNYHWLPAESKAGFIANGDMMKILKIKGYQELHGFRFVDVTVQLIDYADEAPLQLKLLLDTILSESPSLTSEDQNKLYQSVLADNMDEKNKVKRLAKIKSDPFFNALQVKFAYAITCHKAQGGQWPSVFVEQGYITKEMVNAEFYRWLYTALTRATEKLYLVNFNKEFLEEGEG